MLLKSGTLELWFIVGFLNPLILIILLCHL